MKKNIFFVFRGEPMCFIHVLLNALAMDEKGDEVKIIIEGDSVKLLPELVKKENPLNLLWEKVVKKELIAGVCFACANKLGALEEAKRQGFPLIKDMSGHPGMAVWQDNGYTVITF